MWLGGLRVCVCVHACMHVDTVGTVGVRVSVGDVALIKVTFAFDTVIVLPMKEVK